MSVAVNLEARVFARVGQLVLDAELHTADGTLALVGPNGAGKTTFVSVLLGIVPAKRARVVVGETILNDTDAGIDVPVEHRRLGYVPQDYALFPHLSVRDNVAFAALSIDDGSSTATKSEKVDAMLVDLGIAGLADRRPSALSGGEKQRVALARALSARPRALLLDEPTAALDVHSRREVRTFLAQTLESLTMPTIVVTHDPVDARVLANRIVVLESGRVTQTGTWDDLVREPASKFVAEFVAGTSP